LSPLKPPLAARAAGRLVLAELERLVKERVDFAFESTLSGRGYVERLQDWKALGYRIEIIFLQLTSPRLALKRIASRVAQGGHDVPRTDVLRRFGRGLANFENLFKPLADSWELYENSGPDPILLRKSP
jgi:predicted ABC-type ATPase